MEKFDGLHPRVVTELVLARRRASFALVGSQRSGLARVSTLVETKAEAVVVYGQEVRAKLGKWRKCRKMRGRRHGLVTD
jgi:hypothetical protein